MQEMTSLLYYSNHWFKMIEKSWQVTPNPKFSKFMGVSITDSSYFSRKRPPRELDEHSAAKLVTRCHYNVFSETRR